MQFNDVKFDYSQQIYNRLNTQYKNIQHRQMSQQETSKLFETKVHPKFQPRRQLKKRKKVKSSKINKQLIRSQADSYVLIKNNQNEDKLNDIKRLKMHYVTINSKEEEIACDLLKEESDAFEWFDNQSNILYQSNDAEILRINNNNLCNRRVSTEQGPDSRSFKYANYATSLKPYSYPHKPHPYQGKSQKSSPKSNHAQPHPHSKYSTDRCNTVYSKLLKYRSDNQQRKALNLTEYLLLDEKDIDYSNHYENQEHSSKAVGFKKIFNRLLSNYVIDKTKQQSKNKFRKVKPVYLTNPSYKNSMVIAKQKSDTFKQYINNSLVNSSVKINQKQKQQNNSLSFSQNTNKNCNRSKSLNFRGDFKKIIYRDQL